MQFTSVLHNADQLSVVPFRFRSLFNVVVHLSVLNKDDWLKWYVKRINGLKINLVTVQYAKVSCYNASISLFLSFEVPLFM